MTSHFRVRFGMVAVRKGFITAQQSVEDTVIQGKGKPHRSVGAILC